MPFQPIGGQLPFRRVSDMGARFGALGGSPQQAYGALGDIYQGDFNSAADMNESLYNNMLAGYQQTGQGQRDAQDVLSRGYADAYDRMLTGQQNVAGSYGDSLKALQTGGYDLAGAYGGLENRVLGTIAGVGQSRARDIDAAANAQSQAAQQQLINAGLGNSTVLRAANRGVASDRERSQNALAEQIAQMRAGYQSSIGMAGLSQRERQLMAENQQRNIGSAYGASSVRDLNQQDLLGLGFGERAANANTGLDLNQLGWMNTVNAPYPNAGMYSQLAQMYGSQAQQRADAARLQALGQAAANPRNGGPGAIDPRLGVMPGFARGAGGGPPASVGGVGSGIPFMPGAGGFQLGLRTPSSQPGVGSAAFGAGGGDANWGGTSYAGYGDGGSTYEGLSALGGVAGLMGNVMEGEPADPFGGILGGAGSAALGEGYGYGGDQNFDEFGYFDY